MHGTLIITVSLTVQSQNPKVTYAAAGIYTVKLNVTNSAGSNTSTRINYIVVSDPQTAPVAGFLANITSGPAPLAVQFTDTSTGTAPLTYAWDFDNNGVTDSTSQNPKVTYAAAGIYTVKLNVTNSAGSNTSTRINYIVVSDPQTAPVAGFLANITSGPAPLAVQFTDTSSNSPTAWNWSFQDVTGNNNQVWFSTGQNPSWTFGAGNWLIKLNASNSAGGSISIQTTFINVTQVTGGTTLTVRSGAVNDGYVAAWSGPGYAAIRDHAGQAVSTATYANYARLTATTTSNQYDEMYRAVVLFNTSTLPDDCIITGVKFGVRGSSKNNGLGSFAYGVTGFNPTNTAGTFVMGDYQRFYNERWADSDISYANLITNGWNNWTGNALFISNISKTGWTGVMVRDQPDIDNNSALVKWASGATSRFTFEDIGEGTAPFLEITYIVSAGSPVASFTSDVTTGVMPLQVQFTDTSTGTLPLTYAWDFDNNGITDSSVKNPVFTYPAAGTYTVKLNVTNSAGSNTLTRTNYITVTTAPVGPVAGFSANITSGPAPLAVQFTDTSTGTAPLNLCLGL